MTADSKRHTAITVNIVAITSEMMIVPEKIFLHRGGMSFAEIVFHRLELLLYPFVGSRLGARPKSSFLIPFFFCGYQSITCFYIL